MFRKILLLITLTFFSAVPCFSAVYWVDSTTGDDGDNGTTMDLAWATLDYALTSGGLSAGDTVFVRRLHSETPGSDIAPQYSGTVSAPITVMGWPRAAHSWNCDWTNGSTTVDNIDENDADREKHAGRFLTGPDGFDYVITQITDANTVIIDRPYAGTTASNQVVSVKADEDWADDMGTAFGFDDSGWTIKETAYDADADDVPLIDFNDAAYQFYLYRKWLWVFKNIEFKDSSDANGVFYVINNRWTSFVNVLAKQTTEDDEVFFISSGGVSFRNCIIEGSGSGDWNIGISFAGSTIYIQDSAVYNCGGNSLRMAAGHFFVKNVNFGVEIANGDADIWHNDYGFTLDGVYDLKLGGTNGELEWSTIVSTRSGYPSPPFSIVNYQKELGAFKAWYGPGFTVEKVAVSGATPNKKLSDNVAQVTPHTSSDYCFGPLDWKPYVFNSRKSYDAGTYSVKVWIYNDTGNTLNDTTFSDDIVLRCRAEAAGYGDAATEYVSGPWIYSDEIDIADAADADDWDYLQADSIVVGEDGSKIICDVLVSFYDAQADVIFIDPVTVNP